MTKKFPTSLYFQNSDLALCATLCYFGYQIEATERVNPYKVTFLFKRDKKLNNLVKKYWNHQLNVDPMVFFNCIKELKARIHA
jgi:hypothetical protein